MFSIRTSWCAPNPRALPLGLARQLLLTIITPPHTLILSSPILFEVRRVLSYPHVNKRWPLTEDVIGNYVGTLEAAAFMVELPADFPAVVSDPDGDPILQTAVLGRADALCTRDRAFAHELVEEVCREHNIRILDDVVLIQELRKSSD